MRGKVNESEKVVEYLPPRGKVPLAGAAAYTPLVFHGGPLLALPELVSFYWGAFTQAEINGMQTWLSSFAGYLFSQGAPANQDQVVLQYGVFGARVGGKHSENNAPATATEADVKQKIINLQNGGSLPPFAPQRLFLVFTKGIGFSGYGTQWCGYHGSWGKGSYFAICPYPSAGGCGSANPIPSWQSVTSHEILEAGTDPVVGGGWFEGQDEGGDVCSWQEVTLPFGTVQRFADNLQQACSVWTTKYELQVVGVRPSGQVMHTVRFGNGSWQNPAGDATPDLGGGTFANVACAHVGGNLHVCGVRHSGQVMHTIRFADGSWQNPAGDATPDLGGGSFAGVACAHVNGELQVVGVRPNGQVMHTIRFADGSWQNPAGDATPDLGGGSFAGVACAGIGGDLHVVGVRPSGQVMHTIRFADGSWQNPAGDATPDLGGGTFASVACALVGGNLHVCGVRHSGQVMHTIRSADGSWQNPAGDATPDLGGGTFAAVGCGGIGNELQVVGVRPSGQVMHTIRFADGSWQNPAGDATPDLGGGTFVGARCS